MCWSSVHIETEHSINSALLSSGLLLSIYHQLQVSLNAYRINNESSYWVCADRAFICRLNVRSAAHCLAVNYYFRYSSFQITKYGRLFVLIECSYWHWPFDQQRTVKQWIITHYILKNKWKLNRRYCTALVSDFIIWYIHLETSHVCHLEFRQSYLLYLVIVTY